MSTPAKPREWSPRIWEGCDAFAYLELLARNRFAVEFPYWYIAAICSAMSCVNTGLRWAQRGFYGRRIDEMTIEHPPIFVLGHWRTGTTLLHELLILDDRHATPTTHSCLVPCHFLLSERFFKRFLWFLTPDKRPVDNMPAGWDRPQEDEFALCLFGEPGTYSEFAFPNRKPLHPGSLDFSGLTPRQIARWKRTFLRFVKEMTIRDPRRLVLKSPPHTARIPYLLELFPDARFVNIVRDPYSLFASTVNLWTRMAKTHGLQTLRNTDRHRRESASGIPRHQRTLSRHASISFRRIGSSKSATKRSCKDVVGGTEAIYDGLKLGEFENVKPKLLDYAARNKNYETNKYTITPEQRERIRSRWGDLIEQLGY